VFVKVVAIINKMEQGEWKRLLQVELNWELGCVLDDDTNKVNATHWVLSGNAINTLLAPFKSSNHISMHIRSYILFNPPK